MRKYHKKISFTEREQILSLLKQGKKIREIARYLGRSPSSISDETRRNGMTRDNYSLSVAHVDRNIKASQMGRKTKLREGKQPLKLIKKWIIEEKWSPEQVAGRLKIKFRDPKKQVSHETIYKYIYGLPDKEERDKYIKSLRRRRRQRKPRKWAKGHRGPISNPISIHERPPEVNSRKVPGHWEGDSIVGKEHRSAIGTIVERTSRYTIIVEYGNDKSAENVAKAFAKAYESIPNGLKNSLTFDRGAEMAQHELFTQLTGIPVYFADPGCPGQRGTNENTNGLIRQYFPKKTDFSQVSKEELKQVESHLNLRPRKILGFKTPMETLNGLNKGPGPPNHQTSTPERGGSGGDLVPRNSRIKNTAPHRVRGSGGDLVPR
jgi:transposase, IS30 family